MSDFEVGSSIVESFSIEGLYGYRNISMQAPNSAVILIARNGSGKTTLLAAMDAFLNGRFGRLSGLDFVEIKCKLRGEPDVLSLTPIDIEALMTVPDFPEFISMARRVDVDPAELLDFLVNDYQYASKRKTLEENDTYRKIRARYDYVTKDVRRALDKLKEEIEARVPAIDRVQAALQRQLSKVEVIYLPTYRRIELALNDTPSEAIPGRRRQSIQSRLGISKKGLFNTDIQFGLKDIGERLAELNNTMLLNSNIGYREISANIINDMLDGNFEHDVPSSVNHPSKESLELFFSRLKQNSRYTGHFEAVSIPDFDKLYNEGASSPSSSKFLNYFLGKLNSVIQSTRSIEGLVEDFVEHCNAYLDSNDSSVELGAESASGYFDDKVLEIDRLSLQVRVISRAAQRQVPMDSLSSGEKQMVSLFAKLFLYDGPKIVLIDEPELSLSIDWQRKILLDVVGAPTCAQLVAITHSPFVFDNELEPFARPLSLRIQAGVSSQSTFDADLDGLDE
jgi:energy-coupling factor transporter ATP-binding protein EcfA2